MTVPAYILNPGDLRHPITVQAPDGTPTTFGQSAAPTSWVTVLTTRAKIATAGGRETSAAAQIVSDVSHVVTIRYTSTVLKAGYQVLYGGRFFTVMYVENILERNRVLALYCREVNGGGA